MKIVIDIPEEVIEHAKNKSEDSNDEWDAMRAIENGTPFPEPEMIKYMTTLNEGLQTTIKKALDRPHGEWVESKERKGHFYCSECVQQDSTGKWRELFDYKYNFCPNCGSDNRKRGEAE